MTYDDAEIIGKSVKDIYGSYMGKIVGTITEIDGSIQSVGVDCGTRGLEMVPDEHLVIQEDVVIFIPKWRLDSQRLIREKQLTLRRLRALVEIVAGNDEMHMDAEIIQERYHSKLISLQNLVTELRATLDGRLAELDDQLRSTKMLFFDAKIQYKSNEISDKTFESVRLSTSDLIEHMSHEIKEITNIKTRLSGLETEVQEVNDMMGIMPVADKHASADVHLQEPPISSPQEQIVLPEALVNNSMTASTGVEKQETVMTSVTNTTIPDHQVNLMSTEEPETLKQAAEHSSTDPSKQTTVADTASSSNEVAKTTTVVATDSDATVKPTASKVSEVIKTTTVATAVNANVPDVVQSGDTSDLPPAKVESYGADIQHSSSNPLGSMPNMQQPQQHSEQLPQTPGAQMPQSSNIFGHVQQHDNKVADDEAIAFPEPPTNLAPQPSSSTARQQPKNDDDWLSRMESQ